MHDSIIENDSSMVANYLAESLTPLPEQAVEPMVVPPVADSPPEIAVEAAVEESPKRKRRSLKGSSNLYCRIDQRTHLDLKLFAMMEEKSMSEVVNDALMAHVPRMNAPYKRSTG